MSVLGDFVRLDPQLLEQIRATPRDAYARLSDFDEASRLDLDRAWRRLAALMAAARFPINPIAAGSAFPDERTSWGAEADSRSLTVPEVAQAAAHLNQIPFDVLKPHLRSVLEAEDGVYVNLDPTSPRYLEPPPPEEAARIRVPDERLRDIEFLLAEHYQALVTFFDVAAKNGECTVFWAA